MFRIFEKIEYLEFFEEFEYLEFLKILKFLCAFNNYCVSKSDTPNYRAGKKHFLQDFNLPNFTKIYQK